MLIVGYHKTTSGNSHQLKSLFFSILHSAFNTHALEQRNEEDTAVLRICDYDNAQPSHSPLGVILNMTSDKH